jgi:hypothetical protein
MKGTRFFLLKMLTGNVNTITKKFWPNILVQLLKNDVLCHALSIFSVIMLSDIMQSIIMQSVIMVNHDNDHCECHNAQCSYDSCQF